jgi:hypothetical protein
MGWRSRRGKDAVAAAEYDVKALAVGQKTVRSKTLPHEKIRMIQPSSQPATTTRRMTPKLKAADARPLPAHWTGRLNCGRGTSSAEGVVEPATRLRACRVTSTGLSFKTSDGQTRRSCGTV